MVRLELVKHTHGGRLEQPRFIRSHPPLGPKHIRRPQPTRIHLPLGSSILPRNLQRGTMRFVIRCRSHCVFTLKLTAKKQLNDGNVFDTRGKLHLVDLAGSECAKSAAIDWRGGRIFLDPFLKFILFIHADTEFGWECRREG
mmetsp:Transcript_17591/g.26312  ORF Transcript_17591/g.26312 Transcript_17591/m.26312 type:complete len:142 (-) Transcript_17591:3184-3609(-)